VKRSENRILTSHTGALHRPKELQGLALQKYQGRLADDTAYEETLKRAVADVVRKQAELGIDVVNDGEFTKSTWFSYVAERMDGVEFRPAEMLAELMKYSADRSQFAEYYEDAPQLQFYVEQGPELELFLEAGRVMPAVTGPLSYSGHAEIQRDIANLKAAIAMVDVEEAFLPVVAPGSIQPDLKNEYYGSDEDLFKALADALHEEYRAIVEAGLICQIDDAFLTNEWDRRALEPGWTVERFRAWAELSVEALNEAIGDLPEDRIRYHVCWGSWNGPHVSDIPLGDLVDLMLRVKAQTYVIEAANPRHEWEHHVWEEVELPDGKILQPGVIEHVTNVVEHPQTVADRIIRYAERVGRENVIAGTDCGLRMRCHPQVAWAKLQALAQGAEIATKRLWS
jgi:5-methyltetrahydropteroyltriglutamate--homocysteine methyltransferase